jgi:DNA-binding HxlR family transcriptional regulator
MRQEHLLSDGRRFLSRQLARLRHLGVIKRVLGTYRYYLTRAGRAAIAAGRRVTEHTIIPALA